MQIDRQLAGKVVELARPHRIAQPPAGHGIGLGPAIEQDQPVADRGIRQQADMRLAVIDHLVVDLVRHDGDIGPLLQPGNELVDFGFGRDAAGGIGRRVDDDQPRLVG
jgi:hypothetical protein